jgi:hypothetical protein
MSPGKKSAKRKSKTSSKALELVNAANSQVNNYTSTLGEVLVGTARQFI